MIPGITIKADFERSVTMISEYEGSYIVVPMRFLWPSEAKREARAKNPKLCHHLRGAR